MLVFRSRVRNGGANYTTRIDSIDREQRMCNCLLHYTRGRQREERILRRRALTSVSWISARRRRGSRFKRRFSNHTELHSQQHFSCAKVKEEEEEEAILPRITLPLPPKKLLEFYPGALYFRRTFYETPS